MRPVLTDDAAHPVAGDIDNRRSVGVREHRRIAPCGLDAGLPVRAPAAARVADRLAQAGALVLQASIVLAGPKPDLCHWLSSASTPNSTFVQPALYPPRRRRRRRDGGVLRRRDPRRRDPLRRARLHVRGHRRRRHYQNLATRPRQRSTRQGLVDAPPLRRSSSPVTAPPRDDDAEATANLGRLVARQVQPGVEVSFPAPGCRAHAHGEPLLQTLGAADALLPICSQFKGQQGESPLPVVPATGSLRDVS